MTLFGRRGSNRRADGVCHEEIFLELTENIKQTKLEEDKMKIETDGDIFHTYSTYSRGLDLIIGTYNFLNLVPKGRDEDPNSTVSWVRRHDEYEA